ncbi:ricin-type beta-trefoil lectin domain protein, partial [Streptomyces sp. NPDC127574]|uniref:ricin-type beta-trefoil lectin domain protein n=1 Tax=Streptomyces sp. NPDC127574 TaxID=3345401 RepID=UPI00363697A0
MIHSSLARSTALRLTLSTAALTLSVGALSATPAAAATGTITGLGGKCLDVASASSANGAAVQLYDCNGTAAQQWTVGSDGTVRAP